MPKVTVRTGESKRKQEKQHFLEGDIWYCLLIAVRNWDSTVKFNNSSVSGKHKIERWYCTCLGMRDCVESIYLTSKPEQKLKQNKYFSEGNKHLFKTP